MKYKKGFIFICLIICLFSIASVCASDVNETVVANEDQSDEVMTIENENFNKISSNNQDNDYFETDNNSDEPVLENYNIEKKSLSIETEEKLKAIYTKDDIEIMIANNADYDAYCIRIFIYNNLTGNLNVYVDNSLKWSDEITTSDYQSGNYCKYLYPRNLGMDYSTTYNVKVTFQSYSYQCPVTTGPKIKDGSFEELSDEISRSSGELNLIRNYMGDIDTTGIKIKKNMIINGNGHYLTSDGYGRILSISKNFNVTLINMTFSRGHNEYGGAIYIDNANVKIINCTFVGNYAEKRGCAIYGSVKSLLISGTSFSDSDEITDENGLIYLSGNNICIENCKFKNGYSTYHLSLGLRISGNNISIKNCNFNSTRFNKIMYLSGQNITITNCNFIKNYDCIELHTNAGLGTIENCYFNRNEGTLFNLYCSGDALVYNSTFENNHETNIFGWSCYSGKIVSCKFLEESTFSQLINIMGGSPILINNTGWGLKTQISIDRTELYYKDKFYIYLKDSNGNPLNNKQIIMDIDNYHYENITQPGKYSVSPKGYVSLDLSNINIEGNYSANIYFVGDENYDASSLQIVLPIKLKRDTSIDVPNNIISYQPNIPLQVKLYGEMVTIDNKTGAVYYKTAMLSNRDVIVICNNENYTITDNNVIFLNLNPGTYEATSYFSGDDTYDSFKVKFTITVLPSIILSNFKTEFETTVNFNTQFLDENGDILEYQYVLFNVDGEDNVLITNSQGFVNFNKQLISGVHTFKIINPITKEQILKTITVKTKSIIPTKITLTLKKVKVKRSAKKLTIQATLKVNGKAVKGKIIKFKFNKKYYKAKTNSKGVAKITVKKAILKKLKAGKKVKYQATYGKITKKVTVKVKK